MRHTIDLARRAGESDAKVLITGESGVGKDLLAREAHACSHRRNRPYIAVNCAGFPETLLESELFGHARGSFTGADRDRIGKIQMADGGTLFLDEVGEMSLRMQAALLRFLENGEIQTIGEKAHHVDVRLIAATNRNLGERVASGDFREDLLYRLRVIEIKVPALRDRREDIPALTDYFLQRAPRQLSISPEAQEALIRHRWPGNVRELQNVIEHVAVLAEPDQVIQPNDIPIYEDASEWPSDGGISTAVMDDAYHLAKDRIVAQFEKEYLTRLIGRAGGNMSKAARLASIDRTTLYRLMDKHNFHRDELSGTPE